MYKVLYLVALVAAIGCDQTGTQQIKAEKVRRGQHADLLTKYKEIRFDTLKVFSAGDVESKKFKFRGVALDSTDVQLFPKEMREQYSREGGFYGCYKFNIDANHIGLITRTPAMYVSSSIKLFIFDLQKESITHFTELAEVWGDAGAFSNKNSWLMKGADKKWRSFTWLEEGHDNSVENPEDKTTESHDSYYQLGITGKGIDTLSTDSSALARQYKKFLKK